MIPNKSTFKFQELPSITGVKPYVIRFWETEFEEIAPINSDSGQKIYARKDVETILKIKKLLFEDKLSVQEAKGKLNETEIPEPPQQKVQIDLTSFKEPIAEALNLIKEIKRGRGW
jgi:DNA-binding transcriptional MerR regulator